MFIFFIGIRWAERFALENEIVASARRAASQANALLDERREHGASYEEQRWLETLLDEARVRLRIAMLDLDIAQARARENETRVDRLQTNFDKALVELRNAKADVEKAHATYSKQQSTALSSTATAATAVAGPATVAATREVAELQNQVRQDVFSALLCDGFDGEEVSDLVRRLAGYYREGVVLPEATALRESASPTKEKKKASQQLGVGNDSYLERAATLSSRSSATGTQFSKFGASNREVNFRAVDNSFWLGLFDAWSLLGTEQREQRLADLVSELEACQDALRFLAAQLPRPLDEITVIQPLVHHWLVNLADELFPTASMAAVSVYKADRVPIDIPGTNREVLLHGDADRLLAVNGQVGCVVEVKRPFAEFAEGGSAAKDQLIIEIAAFALANGCSLLPGFVTDLFRLNVALRVRAHETDDRWCIYEGRRRFVDSVEIVQATCVALAVGLPSYFPRGASVAQLEASLDGLANVPTRRSTRTRLQPCRFADLDFDQRPPNERDSDPDDDGPAVPPRPGPSSGAAAFASAAVPVSAPGSGTGKTQQRAGGGAAPSDQENVSQGTRSGSSVKSTSSNLRRRAKLVLVRESRHRRGFLLDTNNGIAYDIVSCSEQALADLTEG